MKSYRGTTVVKIKRVGLALAVVSMVASALTSISWASSGGGEGGGDADIERTALAKIESGSPRDAIALLRGEADTVQRTLLLARAYLDDGNDFWALRTLQEAVQQGEDCGPTLWLAFALIRQGALEEAGEFLGEASCPEDSPLEMRRHLLGTLIATTSGEEGEARRHLIMAGRQERAFPEDREAFRALRPSVQEGYITPITGRVELHAGGTSNARAGSPLDPASTGGPPASGLATLVATTQAVLQTERGPKPVLEAEVRALGIEADEARDLSYLHLSARPALLWGAGSTILAGYRFDALRIHGGDRFEDGPLWFHQGHRGELEVEIGQRLTLFGGAGYRDFRESSRSRLEVDLGLGGGFSPASSVRVLGAVTGRAHNASRDFYDLLGATAIVHGQVQLMGGLSARLALMGSVDDYSRSDGYFASGVARRDTLAKLTAGLWSPQSRGGLRSGLTYEFANRSSTAPDYEYLDHRVLVRGQWAFSVDPRGPRAVRPQGHVPLAWGLEREGGALEETIQDLLRQDEAVRAGSSCVD